LHFLPLALLALNFLILSFSYIFYRVTFFKGSKIGTAKFLAGIWHTQKNIESYNSIFRQRIFFQKNTFRAFNFCKYFTHFFFTKYFWTDRVGLCWKKDPTGDGISRHIFKLVDFIKERLFLIHLYFSPFF
jgi:hypothetical protein